jgi:hypothetical protein
MAKQTLVFQDGDAFYARLRDALKSGDEIEVITNYARYADVPEKLKEVFELEKHRSGKWVNVGTGLFVPGTGAIAALNTKSLVVLAAVAGGALAGCLAGPFGAAVGAGVGLAAGTVASVMMDREHEAEVEIDKSGKLTIRIRPAKKN